MGLPAPSHYVCCLHLKSPSPRTPVLSLFPPARLPERGPAQGLRRKTFKVRHYPKFTSNQLGQARRLLLALACIALLGILTLGRPGAAAAQDTPTGFLEIPGPGSFQSGIGIISGWVCTATNVVIEINGTPFDVVYGGERLDTGEVCGDTDNGFTTMAFNWSLLGDGQHTVVAKADGVEIGRATVTVTTLGAGFVTGLTRSVTVQDFPMVGETVLLEWQQTLQNFMIVGGVAPDDTSEPGIAGVGYLELPAQNSFQSGIGIISGWVCTATNVVIEINGTSYSPTYGGERTDTQDSCDDTDNGFAMAFNWSLLGDGQHTVVAKADGVEIGRATVTVTTLGAEFVRGAEGETLVQDFPSLGKAVRLVWQQSLQNFMIVGGVAPDDTSEPGIAGVGYLELPAQNSFQSGIGIISGWVCTATNVVIEINGTSYSPAYRGERRDTGGVCGDTDNGFAMAFNWNLLGDGQHTVVAKADNVEIGRATVTVTTLGEEFVRGLTRSVTVQDFPMVGETVLLEWQQNLQNFMIVDGVAPDDTSASGIAGVWYLELPAPNSFQSGIGIISGWVCTATNVVIEINGTSYSPAYRGERRDTGGVCGRHGQRVRNGVQLELAGRRAAYGRGQGR